MAKFRGIFRGKTAKYVTVRAENEAESHKQREVPDGLWQKCDACRAVLYTKDLERNQFVCATCGCHFAISARTRLSQLVDDLQSFEELDASLCPANPLDFPQYPEKVIRDTEKTGQRDAVVTGIGEIGGVRTVIAVMEFKFMGGSMGAVVGEKVTRAFEKAIELGLPVVTVSASGGARMQESIFSLMQMQKTSAAVERHSRAGGLYISVLTHPTTAGVFGSFASLADVILAEPGATIGFAGQRVIEETIRKAVPPNLQKAETVYANGFIDRVVPRTELKDHIAKLLLWHTAEAPIKPAEAKPRSADAAPDEEDGRSAAGDDEPGEMIPSPGGVEGEGATVSNGHANGHARALPSGHVEPETAAAENRGATKGPDIHTNGHIHAVNGHAYGSSKDAIAKSS